MEKQSLLEAMFKEATLGVLVANTAGEIILANPLTERLFGYTGIELIGASVDMLLPIIQQKGHHKHRLAYHKNPRPRLRGVGRELFGKRKNGKEFPIEISLSSTTVDGEQYIVAFITDISERKKVAEDLEDSQSRMEAIIKTAVDGIITTNQEGIVESINPAAAQLFGYEPEEIIGENINRLMPQPDQSKHDAYIRRYRETGEKKVIGIGREVIGLKKDKTTFPVHLSISATQLNNKTIYTGILHDLTEQKRAKEKLNNYTIELENKVNERTEELGRSESKLKEALKKEIELGELKSRFVAMASHEFRTPLSTILSSADLIGIYPKSEQQDKREKHIKRITSSVENLTSILNDFLSLEKLESDKIRYEPHPIESKEFLRELLEDLRLLTKENQNIILTQSGDNLIQTDPHLLKNILFNLLSNAIKYSPTGKDIYLRIENANQLLKIKVEDQGIGIPLGDQKYMFTRFFRASNAANIKGTGLGLIIVKRYLDLMKGEISFTSVPNEGSTFIVSIPQ